MAEMTDDPQPCGDPGSGIGCVTPGCTHDDETTFPGRVIPVPVPDELVKLLCTALGEPYETSSGHPMEPAYRMTWERALDLVRGRTVAWASFLTRIEEVDPDWLNDYRSRAASPISSPISSNAAVPLPTESANNRRSAARNLAFAAQRVMDLLTEHGPGIVGHLLDTDDNAGQRLRILAAQVLEDTDPRVTATGAASPTARTSPHTPRAAPPRPTAR